ncbi:MAG TPA: phosphatase PAP2 family protein [Acidimicrobiia bacterium]|jgi:undecaprenyl-diphosphatase|nr:phosphatase PAP2 family protein [Acidimicrobiia bacterium]
MDEIFFRFLNGLAGQWGPVDQLIQLLSSDHLFPLLSVLALVWLWLAAIDEEERVIFQRGALSALLAVGLASAAVTILAILFGKARPFTELANVHLLFYRPTDPAFPANSVAVVVAAGTAIARQHRHLGKMIVWAGLAMGVARIVAGVHWPSDVIFGALVGAAIGSKAHRVLTIIEPFATMVTTALLGPLPATRLAKHRR